MPSLAPWLIFLLPLLSFVLIVLIFRPFFKEFPKISGYVTILAIAGSLALSLWALSAVAGSPSHVLALPDIDWMLLGDVHIKLGLAVDSLTVVMLVVVCSVSLLVQIYSQGYMHGDPGYHRYFAFMSLFTASMLGLVLAANLLLVYVFWELVGLCSYLLIGFWFHRPAAAAAAKKAFIVTRLGDFGFLIAILFLYFKTGTFDIAELQELAIAGVLSGTALTWVAIGIFSGAVGKSAQFPLHVWLPDAMEGPTPVSALIHAATMVAAGVYLVARTLPLFAPSAEAMTTVAYIGGFTAIFAASMGLVANDIKRMMAYSTISQLGYMMLALGLGGYVAGMFHLFNHAFFKALLFLGSGSVNHATGTFDMREMGGLRRYMPWTFVTLTIASLSLAGIPPFSGFWSKDEIIGLAWEKNPLLFYIAMAVVFLTAFYVFRAMFMTFGGEYRGAHQGAHGGHHGHGGLHESPAVMVIPMAVLAIPAVISGFVNAPGFLSFLGIPPHWLADFMKTPLLAEIMERGEVSFNFGLAGVSTLVSALGIFLAYAMYGAKWLSAERVGRVFGPIYTLVYRKYFFDELYENVIVIRGLVDGFFRILGWLDTYIIDGAVNGTAWLTVGLGRGLRRVQTGQLQAYGLAIFIGIVAIVAAFLLRG